MILYRSTRKKNREKNMKTELYIIAHDNGTSGTKTVLAKITDKIEIVSSHLTEYEVFYPEGIPNACEQDPKDWWRAICDGTKKVMEESGLSPNKITAILFPRKPSARYSWTR